MLATWYSGGELYYITNNEFHFSNHHFFLVVFHSSFLGLF